MTACEVTVLERRDMTEPILKLDDLRQGLWQPQRPVRAVDGVSLDVRRGETLAVVGKSGCGKSTMARLILRLVEPTSGRIVFDRTDISGLSQRRMRAVRRQLQFVFQDPFSSLDPRMRAGTIVTEPQAVHGLFANRAERRSSAVRPASRRWASARSTSTNGRANSRADNASGLGSSAHLP